MKKSLILVGFLAISYGNSQQQEDYSGRVGINTDQPKASLHIGRHTGIPETSPQGMLLPHLTKEQRNAFDKEQLTKGLMIFNTSKNCIDWWNGSRWKCMDGTQADIPLPATAPIVLPEIELGNSAYWFSSIYDNDYLSITGDVSSIASPAGSPSFATKPADGIATGGDLEPVLDVQGVIPTQENAVDRAISITVRRGGNLPAFTTYAYIPDEYTVDGQGGIVVLSWDGEQVDMDTRQLGIKIYAKDKAIQLKKLDLVAGQGADQLGFKMTSFSYPKTKAESEQAQSAWTGRYDLHLISGIPDRNFVNATTIGTEGKKYRHQFLYVPVMGPDGKIWLNNNLGADYANIHKPVFNPGQQAKTYSDHFAYGSLFQWGRVADGHELMTWTSSGTGTPVFAQTPYNWSSDMSSQLTQFNENCPDGWHTPQKSEFDRLASANTSGTVNIFNTSFFVGGLRVPYAGYRNLSSGSTLYDTGGNSNLWSRTEHSSPYAYSLSSGLSVNNYYYRSHGYALRCLKD